MRPPISPAVYFDELSDIWSAELRIINSTKHTGRHFDKGGMPGRNNVAAVTPSAMYRAIDTSMVNLARSPPPLRFSTLAPH